MSPLTSNLTPGVVPRPTNPVAAFTEKLLVVYNTSCNDVALLLSTNVGKYVELVLTAMVATDKALVAVPEIVPE